MLFLSNNCHLQAHSFEDITHTPEVQTSQSYEMQLNILKVIVTTIFSV